MAQTKRDQDRAEKRDEIIAAARTLFIDTGYEDTSISRLASAAGVAPNTIYWYFKDKDEVLVAVLDAEFSDGMAEYEKLPAIDAAERLFWVVQRLTRVSRLVSTVHSRLDASEAINRWHEEFHAISEGVLRVVLEEEGVPEDWIEARTRISVFTIEGLLAHSMSEQEQRAICRELVRA
jgi:AcrR family transcriptional regulator